MKPLVAITMGDPAGVGPETIVGAWREVNEFARPVAIGHGEIFRRAAALFGSRLELVEIRDPGEADPAPGRMPYITAASDDAAGTPPAQVDARGGRAAYDCLVRAAKFALAGQIDALVTAPLNKAALWKAGYRYPGHTELLAELCRVHDYAMMLYLAPGGATAGPHGLAIVHVTLHMALRDVFEALTPDAILVKTRLVHDVMLRLSGVPPRIGICALNPHGGEQGLFGDEETRIIAPAVERAQAESLNALGPFPADTLIARARDGQFDAVVAMYHDQGHIAIKLLAMHRAVNVTLGLPIVRTSVAHGTAFDLAWQGRAETAGMVEAVRVASRLAAAPAR